MIEHSTRFRNRIVGHGDESPDQLLANPLNSRIHPLAQQEVLSSVLDAVGWVTEVIVNRRSGFVVDGHLRVALALSALESSIPVTYVDLDPAEEALIIALLDPISALAVLDGAQFKSVLDEVMIEDENIDELLASLASSASVTFTEDDPAPRPIDRPADGFVKFTFGEHAGIVRADIYTRFAACIQEIRDAQRGAITLDDILERVVVALESAHGG